MYKVEIYFHRNIHQTFSSHSLSKNFISKVKNFLGTTKDEELSKPANNDENSRLDALKKILPPTPLPPTPQDEVDSKLTRIQDIFIQSSSKISDWKKDKKEFPKTGIKYTFYQASTKINPVLVWKLSENFWLFLPEKNNAPPERIIIFCHGKSNTDDKTTHLPTNGTVRFFCSHKKKLLDPGIENVVWNNRLNCIEIDPETKSIISNEPGNYPSSSIKEITGTEELGIVNNYILGKYGDKDSNEYYKKNCNCFTGSYFKRKRRGAGNTQSHTI